jgi:hypothetical protein
MSDADDHVKSREWSREGHAMCCLMHAIFDSLNVVRQCLTKVTQNDLDTRVPIEQPVRDQ